MSQIKREVSLFVPYQINDGKVRLFMQKRDEKQERSPGFFAFFGGGVDEGESPEAALVREVREELDLDLVDHTFFGDYDTVAGVKHVYVLKVDDDFKNKITVLEGEYGKFLNEKDVASEPKIIEHDKEILHDLFQKLY